MAYTHKNFRSKKEMKASVAAGQIVTVYQPGPFGPDVKDGVAFLEGPHYPEAHKWYAEVTVKNGIIVGKVK
jgi:hypothetical protein